MTISKTKVQTLLCATVLSVAGMSSTAQEVGPECRGVAAGVVAAMKSSGEISSSEAASAAIVAARRACAVALEGGLEGRADSSVDGANKPQTTASKKTDDEDDSFWDFLSRDRNTKDGHDRLRRLRQQ